MVFSKSVMLLEVVSSPAKICVLDVQSMHCSSFSFAVFARERVLQNILQRFLSWIFTSGTHLTKYTGISVPLLAQLNIATAPALA